MLPQDTVRGDAAVERSLLSQVLLWLGASLLLTAAGVYVSKDLRLNGLLFIVLIVALFGLIFGVQGAVAARNQGLAAGLFSALAVVEGIFIGPIIWTYLRLQPDVLENALLGTVGVFVVAAAVVWMTSFDFAAWGKWLLGALLVGIVLSIAAYFLPFDRLLLDVFLGAVFVGLTFFDFWRVKAQRAGDNNALLLALSLYLDFINLFLILLRIFGRRR
jgi:FtsH-binding integral membrane protein